jgi:hypothetical protein
LLEVVKSNFIAVQAVLEIQSVVVGFQVKRLVAYSAAIGNGNRNFVTVFVNAYDIECDKTFAVVQFKFRQIILSKFGDLENFVFHRFIS